MAQGGGAAGGMGGSPMGASTGGTGSQSTPNMGGGIANSTNSTTTQNIMGGQQGGFGDMGGYSGGYSGGYGGMGGYGGFGGQQQGQGQIPEFVSPFFQQMQQMRQQQPQLNQLGGGNTTEQTTAGQTSTATGQPKQYSVEEQIAAINLQNTMPQQFWSSEMTPDQQAAAQQYSQSAAPQNTTGSGNAAPQNNTGGFGFNAGNYMSATGTPIPWYLQAANYNLPDAQKARVIAGVNSTGPTASMTGGMQDQPGAAPAAASSEGIAAVQESEQTSQKNQNNKKKSELPTDTLEMLYSAYLNRAPDKGGLEYWNKKFGSTIDADEVAEFRKAATPELAANKNQAANKKQAKNNKLTVEDLYSTYLDRASDKGGLDYWDEKFGSTIDANEVSEFINAAAPELAAKKTQVVKKDKPKKNNNKKAKPVEAPKDLTDFSRMGQAGQFGGHGFAQGLQNYVGQQYGDYAYNPANQTFYKKGNKNSKGPTLEQMLQQGRAAGYKMASGGIASLRRKG